MYAEASEILDYLKATVTKFNLRQYIQFNTTCTGASWDERHSEWHVTLQKSGIPDKEIRVKCDVFILATGRLNNWKLPDIEGLNKFQGSVIHTADWQSGLDYRGKDIAVIGNGASSTQCLAKLSKGETLTIEFRSFNNIRRCEIYWQFYSWTNISGPACLLSQWRTAGQLFQRYNRGV